MPLADFQTLVDQMVRDSSGKFATADRDNAIAQAVMRYSKDRPRTIVEDLVAPGGNLLDLPSGWQADVSELRTIEYPIGNIPPTFIPQDEVTFYQTPAAIKLMLRSAITAGQSVRATYTIGHVLAGAQDTVPAKDREAVCAWAAALALDELAAYFSQISDTTLQVDVADRRSIGAELASRANRFRSRYFDELGVDPKRNVAAGVVVQIKDRDSLGNERLWHPPTRFR